MVNMVHVLFYQIRPHRASVLPGSQVAAQMVHTGAIRGWVTLVAGRAWIRME